MTEDGDIAIDDPMYRFCVSWYTIRVANVGIGLLVSSWNEHRIPCKFLFYLYHLVHFLLFHFSISSSQRRIRNGARNSKSFNAYG